MASLDQDLTIVIRGVSERTEKLCQALLAKQIDPKNIQLIHVSPFSAALKKSYQLGIDGGRPWTMVIDADILVASGIVQKLLSLARKQPKSVFAVQSEMIDKFFGGQRVGGIKLYRTSLLPAALKLVPDVNVRPEGNTIKQMHRQGYYVKISDYVCGLHDFEQFYSDIYRKGFAHGIKHVSLTDLILPYWKREAEKDQDFAVLLAGFELGKKHVSDLKLAKDEVAKEFAAYAKQTKLAEKDPLSGQGFGLEDIDRLVEDFQSPPEYIEVERAIKAMGRPSAPRQWLGLSRFFKTTK